MDTGTTRLTVGIDIGGTKLCAALVDDGGQVVAAERHPAPADGYEAALDAMAAVVSRLRAAAEAEGAAVTAAGVATAAFLDADRELVRHATNLGWRDRAVRADLAHRIGLPVIVENDADAAAWGEYVHGAAREEPCVVMATVGTGIGGAIVVGGRLLSGAHGLAGEFGHMQVTPDGLRCGCGARGCLEQYASGTAVARLARAAALAAPDRTRLLEQAAGDPERIDGRLVTRLAGEGDAAAGGALAEAGWWLGRGLAMVAAVVDPSVVVVGGGLAAAAGELLLGPARAAYGETIAIGAVRPVTPIRAAMLANDAGAIGAAALARGLRGQNDARYASADAGSFR